MWGYSKSRSFVFYVMVERGRFNEVLYLNQELEEKVIIANCSTVLIKKCTYKHLKNKREISSQIRLSLVS